MIGYIYCVTCLRNVKSYFGQTSKTIMKRWKEHVDSSHREDTKFYRAIRKYGSENFVVEEVIHIEALTKEVLRKKLDFLERHFIKRYNTKRNGYNSTDGGDGVLGLKFSEESRKKMSKSHKGKSFWNKGRAWTERERKVLSEAHKGKSSSNKGVTGVYHHIDELKRQNSERMKEMCRKRKMNLI